MPPSPAARATHLLLGAVAPILCLVLDPIVFRVSGIISSETAFLGRYRMFGYTATLLAALLVIVAVTRGVSRLVGGMLYAAAIVATLLGIALLPFIIIGAFLYGLGFLGLLTFAAAWVYVRYARQQRFSLPAALLFVLIPLLAQIAVNESVAAAVRSGNARVLRATRLVYDADLFVIELARGADDARRRQLTFAYETMRGSEPEDRMAELDD
ncbi:MAG TPA: hypothetical protein VF824_20515 [Thermoanaerobaculia bacterium]|jgi:hypothetical protein